MKQLFIFVFIFSCLCLSIQGQELSVIGKTTTFSYDLNGNIISRRSISLASAKTQGGMKEQSGGDMTIIGGGNGKFTIDIKKDANQTANFSLYNNTAQPSCFRQIYLQYIHGRSYGLSKRNIYLQCRSGRERVQ